MAANSDAPLAMTRPVRGLGLLAAITASLLLGACAQVGDDSTGLFSSLTPEETQQAAKDAAPTEPQAAAEYWGKLYSKNPRDLGSALAYAQSLKALGQKREALAVLQQASLIHGTNRELAADYGRLALELDQVSVAKKLLEVADDPGHPDWRIILARGTALAKEGSYREAIGFYERAQALNPGHPSVLNNLALAYTMSGEPARGEQLLRQASASGGDNAKVRQNLALVLGLQGKYAEATQVASSDLAPADAEANTALLRKMVKLDPKTSAPVAPAQAVAEQAAPVWPGPPPVMTTWAPAVAEAEATAAQGKGPGLRASSIETGFGAADDARAASLFSAE
ncbi:MAG: tetratricopeptide repeat protein [Hyphomicrobium sp.]|uniref:tetratricopeptide repeat protein n=1 Tax=Hyphomicrobium sp. TaxID=82 RepID=UPI003D0C570B